jgi:hypothetical protein
MAFQPNIFQIFQDVDKDRSGKISENELQKALSNRNRSTWRPFNMETCRRMIGISFFAFFIKKTKKTKLDIYVQTQSF